MVGRIQPEGTVSTKVLLEQSDGAIVVLEELSRAGTDIVHTHYSHLLRT